MKHSEYISAYEDILLGYTMRKNNSPITGFPRGCFSDDIPAVKRKQYAVEILRYAFINLLKWDSDVCLKSINKKIIVAMKLDTILPYLDIPDEYNSVVDPKFFTHLIYPDKVSFDRTSLDIQIYKDILNGKLEVGKDGVMRKKSYPKRFFQDTNGYERAILCMSYALKNNGCFEDIEDVYRKLCDPVKHFIKDNKLVLADSNFETPIDFVHDALASSQQDMFYYAYYKYRYLYLCAKSSTNQSLESGSNQTPETEPNQTPETV